MNNFDEIEYTNEMGLTDKEKKVLAPCFKRIFKDFAYEDGYNDIPLIRLIQSVYNDNDTKFLILPTHLSLKSICPNLNQKTLDLFSNSGIVFYIYDSPDNMNEERYCFITSNDLGIYCLVCKEKISLVKGHLTMITPILEALKLFHPSLKFTFFINNRNLTAEEEDVLTTLFFAKYKFSYNMLFRGELEEDVSRLD